MRTATVGYGANPEALEAELEDAAERMDVPHVIHQALDVYHALPEDVSHAALKHGKVLYKLAPFLIARFMATVKSIFAANPQAWGQLIARGPATGARQLAVAAGQAMGLQSQTPRVRYPPGMSPVQVRQYQQRQRARGYNPGRQRGGRQREMQLEFELGLAANALTAEAEFALNEWFYFDSWTLAPDGWKYLARDGPMRMKSLEEAKGTVATLRLKYQTLARSMGGREATVQCFAYYPQTQRWGAC